MSFNEALKIITGALTDAIQAKRDECDEMGTTTTEEVDEYEASIEKALGVLAASSS